MIKGKSVVPIDLIDALHRLEERLRASEKLDASGLRAELVEFVERVRPSVELLSLPDVDFESWLEEAKNTIHNVGSGSLGWPDDRAERFALGLHLIGTCLDGARLMDICLGFVPGSGPLRNNTPGLVERILLPLIADMRRHVEGSPAVAVCFTHEASGPLLITLADDLRAIRDERGQVEHFIDAVDDAMDATTAVEGKTIEERLTPGEAAMLVEVYLRSFGDPTWYFQPKALKVPTLVGDVSHRKVFDTLRRKIDVDLGGGYRLFPARKIVGGRHLEYRFEPDLGVTYCFLFRPDYVATIRERIRADGSEVA